MITQNILKNIVNIEFYGDYQILVKSLFLNNINVTDESGCIINTIIE